MLGEELARRAPEHIEQAWRAGLWVFVRAADATGLPPSDGVLLPPTVGSCPTLDQESP